MMVQRMNTKAIVQPRPASPPAEATETTITPQRRSTTLAQFDKVGYTSSSCTKSDDRRRQLQMLARAEEQKLRDYYQTVHHALLMSNPRPHHALTT